MEANFPCQKTFQRKPEINQLRYIVENHVIFIIGYHITFDVDP